MAETQTRNRGGRPTKLTPEVQERIVSAIRAGNYAQVAARYAGIGETTYYEWMKRGRAARSGKFAEFQKAIKKAEGEAEVRCVALIHKHMEGNWQAAMTYLERKFPDRWARTNRIKVDLNSLEILQDTLGVSKEDLNELIGSVDDAS